MIEHVVILGGGACGMSAALVLARRGVRVTVLECEPRAGGLCGTQERDGFRFDLGGHRFLPRSAATAALVRDVLGEELLVRTRSSVVMHRGERYLYPLELDDVVRRFGVRRGVRAVASYAGERLRQRAFPSADRSFEDWVVHRFGRELYDAFFGPYTEKLWGLPPSEISADWAAQRISLPSLGDVLMRLVGARRGTPPRTYARRYLYPRLGIGQIFERMSEVVRGLGGTILLGERAIALGHAKGKVSRVTVEDREGRQRELACDAVLSTLALPSVARMLGPLSPRVARSSSNLRFRGIRLLNVMLDRPRVTPHTWMYVSEPRYLAARIQEPRHRSPAAAPEGKTSLMMEIPCAVGDDVWRAPREQIYERCMDDLASLGIPDLGDLRRDTLGSFDSFVEQGYPIYHLDYRSDRARTLEHVGRFANLVTCGRQGAFRYVFMDTAMEMGMRAAAVLLDGGDRLAPAELGSEQGLIEAKALTA